MVVKDNVSSLSKNAAVQCFAIRSAFKLMTPSLYISSSPYSALERSAHAHMCTRCVMFHHGWVGRGKKCLVWRCFGGAVTRKQDDSLGSSAVAAFYFMLWVSWHLWLFCCFVLFFLIITDALTVDPSTASPSSLHRWAARDLIGWRVGKVFPCRGGKEKKSVSCRNVHFFFFLPKIQCRVAWCWGPISLLLIFNMLHDAGAAQQRWFGWKASTFACRGGSKKKKTHHHQLK